MGLFIAFVLLPVVTTYSLVGLIAVWGALGGGHWFFRMTVVLLLLSAWLLAADDRLCLLFLSQTAVVVLRLWFLRSREARLQVASLEAQATPPVVATRPHFSLLDLLLAVVLLSGVLAMLVRLRAEGYSHWLQDILPGAVLGCFTLVAVWAARSTSSVGLRMTLLIVAVPSLLMGVGLWLARTARSPATRAAVAVGCLLLAVMPIRLYYLEVTTRLRSYPPPLADNGYADLLLAGQSIDLADAVIDTLRGAELREFVVKHRRSLAQAEAAVVRPCQAVVPNGMNDNAAKAELLGIGKLAHALAAQGRLRISSGQPSNAAESFLTAIQLGAEIAQGGIMAHDWFGMPCEQAGVEGLQSIIEQLHDDDCRQICQELLSIEAAREPVENCMGREKLFLKKEYPWKFRLYPSVRNLELTDAHDVLWRAISGLKRARLRLLACHLALRRSWLASGNYPHQLQALVPRYLPEVPRDPFGDGDLVYRKQSHGYRLYSIGIDLFDDGGQPMAPLTGYPLPKGDLVVDPIGFTD